MSNTPLPAACTVCGAIFPTQAISVGGGITVVGLTIKNVEDRCPHCGGLAYAAEGVFNVANQVATVISASNVTREMLQAFAAAIREAGARHADPETLAKAVEKIDPEFGKLVRANSRTGLYAALLAIILAAINSCTLDVKLDGNRLIDQLIGAPPPSVSPPHPTK
jgi:hypothetical protein